MKRAMADVDKVAAAICAADAPIRVWSRLGPASKSYYRKMAFAAIDALDLYEEHEEAVPVWVQEFNEDGSPVMREDIVPPHPKSHIEWVAKRRLVTPWHAVGQRHRAK